MSDQRTGPRGARASRGNRFGTPAPLRNVACRAPVFVDCLACDHARVGGGQRGGRASRSEAHGLSNRSRSREDRHRSFGGGVLDSFGHRPGCNIERVGTGLEIADDVFRWTNCRCRYGDLPVRSGAYQSCNSAPCRASSAAVAAGDVLRCMTGSAMAETFDQIGAAVPHIRLCWIGLKHTRLKIDQIPGGCSRPANVEREPQAGLAEPRCAPDPMCADRPRSPTRRRE